MVILLRTGSLQVKRSVSKMYLMVNRKIRFFASKDKYLLPYRRSSSIFRIRTLRIRTLLTPARRVRLCSWKELQSSKKCSVSCMPSFTRHIGLIVSLKLCLNLWKLSLLNPTLNWVRYVTSFGSCMPYTNLAGGLIIKNTFFLNT